MAQLLFQITDDRTRAVSRARSVYSVHEAEEHTTTCEGRGADHALGSGVLRLKLGLNLAAISRLPRNFTRLYLSADGRSNERLSHCGQPGNEHASGHWRSAARTSLGT